MKAGPAAAPGGEQAVIEYLSRFVGEARQQRIQRVLENRTRHVTVVLEDVYRSQNASAVLRTCECLGVQELHVIENRHDYQLNPAVTQGASKWIDLFRHNCADHDNTTACVKALKQRGYRVIAMTPAPSGKTPEQLEVDDKLALCFGSEEPGLSAGLLEQADETARIPMHGFTRSFNLSVSAAISLHTLLNRLRNSSVAWRLNDRESAQLHIRWLAQSTPAGQTLLDAYLRENQGRAW